MIYFLVIIITTVALYFFYFLTLVFGQFYSFLTIFICCIIF